jgi:peptide/nickel transport system substrate-binding protein
MDLQNLDNAVFNERAQKSTFDAMMDGYMTDPGPSGMKQRWGTGAIGFVPGKGVSGSNSMRYSNPRVDAALDSATATFDFARSKAFAARASQTIIDDVPAVFLYDMFVTHALSRRVTATPLRTDAWWADLADWKIPANKRIDRDRIGLAQATP